MLPDCSGVVRRYVVVKVGEELYGIDANCASCKFPVIEGNVSAPAPHSHRCFSFPGGSLSDRRLVFFSRFSLPTSHGSQLSGLTDVVAK
jgi:hypothetical protein